MLSRSPSKFMVVSFFSVLVLSLIIFYPNFDEPLHWENYLEIELEMFQGLEIGQFFLGYHGNQWKPLTRISMYLQYLLFGFDALGYRIIVFVFYVLISVLAIYFTKLITNSEKIALISGLIFTVHFCHWEIIVQTNAFHHSLLLFFYLLTLIFHTKYLLYDHSRWLNLAFITCIFAMLSSQTWSSLVVVLIGLEILIKCDKFTEIFQFKRLLKYTPFILLAVLHAVFSVLLQIGKNSPHDPLASSSVFNIYAPVFKNLIVYLIELTFPVVSFNMPMLTKWTIGILILLFLFALFLKKDKKINFYIFWFFISQFIFLFWVWDYPQGRYTYLSSIPFSILAVIVIFEGYGILRNRTFLQRGYAVLMTVGISAFIIINCLFYYITDRVEMFHTSGRNHEIFLESFKANLPVIPEGSVIYITGLPEHNHYHYGQWTSEKEINWLLPLFYSNSFIVKFVDNEKFDDLLKSNLDTTNEFFLKFNNMQFYLMNTGYSSKD